MTNKLDDYHIAWNIYTNEGIEEIDETQMASHYIDPEKAYLKKEAFQLLSDEAKEVINMIIHSPSESLKAISTSRGLLTKRSIRLGLQKLWSSKFIAKMVVDELTKWANRL